jgi:hypothetical protein
MTPEQESSFDQGTAFLADSLARFWRRMYSNLLEEKFTEDQAMRILLVYIKASSTVKSNDDA